MIERRLCSSVITSHNQYTKQITTHDSSNLKAEDKQRTSSDKDLPANMPMVSVKAKTALRLRGGEDKPRPVVSESCLDNDMVNNYTNFSAWDGPLRRRSRGPPPPKPNPPRPTVPWS